MARKSKVKDITIESHSLIGNLDNVRKQMAKIDYNNADITVMASQQGTGKTYRFREYCKAHSEERIFYMTNKHELLDENEEELDETCHWYGFDYYSEKHEKYMGCPSLNDQNKYERIKKMKNLELNAGIICSVMGCDKEACGYRQQFKTEKRIVLAPVQYLDTDYIFDIHPDIVFIDENFLRLHPFVWDDEKFNDAVDSIEKACKKFLIRDTDFIEQLRAIIQSRGIELISYDQELDKNIWSLLRRCAENKEWTLLKKINNLHKNLRGFIEYAIIYQDFDRNAYYKPFIYDIFPIVEEGIPIVLLNASFNLDLFKLHIYGYNGEFGFEKPIKVNVYTSHLKNKDTIVYRMDRNWDYPKVNFVEEKYDKKETYEHFGAQLERICDIYGARNVGVITFKDITETDPTNKNRERYHNVDAMHFGAVSGLNKFKEKDVLVMIGTYSLNVEDVIDEYNKNNLENLNIKEYKEMISGRDEGGWRMENGKIVDIKGSEKFEIIDELGYGNNRYKFAPIKEAYFENEQYDAFHRVRPLLSKKTIFAYCKLPRGIERDLCDPISLKTIEFGANEFTVESYNKEDSKALFKRLKHENKRVKVSDEFMQDILEGIAKGKSNREIAKEIKIWDKKGNPDIQFVERVRKRSILR